MVEMTMRVPDAPAPKLRQMNQWLPVALELSLAGFKTPAAQTVAEAVEFLSKDPTRGQVVSYRASARAQKRLKRLLTLNESGLPSREEQDELDELETLDHLLVMLKAQAREKSSNKHKRLLMKQSPGW
jgi:multidrug resistance efflux pump